MATELKTFSDSQFIGKPILADADFIVHLETINELAKTNGLKIFITSSTRPLGVPVSGAVVPPAKMSNHFVGHAIDMNVQMGGTLFNSNALGNFSSLPSAIKTFLNAIRSHPVLRWGGDFGDPVHIDDGLNIREPSTWRAKLPTIQSELTGLTQPGTSTGSSKRLLFLTTPLMQGEDVKAVQKKLIEKGFDVGSKGADGFFGQATAKAVLDFQDQANLEPIDGIVGDKTRQALGLT